MKVTDSRESSMMAKNTKFILEWLARSVEVLASLRTSRRSNGSLWHKKGVGEIGGDVELRDSLLDVLGLFSSSSCVTIE